MQPRHLASLPTRPWKNGGGSTRELACFPQDAGLENFIWRISIAEVRQSGPFSLFPGIERIITLLKGDGLHLHFADGRAMRLDRPGVPFPFHGEDALEASLLGSASEDLNLMFRPDRVSAQCTLIQQAQRITHTEAHPTHGLVLLAFQGSWQVDVDALNGNGNGNGNGSHNTEHNTKHNAHHPSPPSLCLAAEQALVWTSQWPALQLTPSTPDSRLLCCQMTALPEEPYAPASAS